MMKLIQIERGYSYAQAANCLFCLHIGGTVISIGTGAGGFGARLELFTDLHRFRFRRRTREKSA